MSDSKDHEQVADELGREADDLEEQSDKLQSEIGDVRQDWESKRASEGVPGAPPRREQSDSDRPGNEVNPEDAEREQHEDPDEPERADADTEAEAEADDHDD